MTARSPPWSISWQAHGEGVKAIALVTDEPDKYAADVRWAPGTTLHHRRELNWVQTKFRQIPGASLIIYDQTCAAEKRRRRKRNQYPDPAKRLFINSELCEGCGDCGLASNCTALLPKETLLGRKREIDQSACNKDYSCVEGFCPSFVTVLGGGLRKPKPVALSAPTGQSGALPAATPVGAETEGMDQGSAVHSSVMPAAALPEPERPALDAGYNIVITGVGGTGVVTLGALLGMAAQIEGKGFGVLDMTGLAQKGGAVLSHLRLAPCPEDIGAIRIAAGGADLVIGCDSMVTAGAEALRTIRELPAKVQPGAAPHRQARQANRPSPEAGVRPLDAQGIPPAGAAERAARHALRFVRLRQGKAHGAPPHRGLRTNACAIASGLVGGQLRRSRGAGRVAGGSARLRPCQRGRRSANAGKQGAPFGAVPQRRAEPEDRLNPAAAANGRRNPRPSIGINHPFRQEDVAIQPPLARRHHRKSALYPIIEGKALQGTASRTPIDRGH